MNHRPRRIIALFVSLTLMTTMPGCQTLKDRGQEQERQAELLTTQKTLVVNFINQGQPNMALKELRSLITQHPQDADFKNLMGLCYLSLQNPKMALKSFEDSYRLEARAPVALNISSAYIETKQYPLALKTLRNLLASPLGKNYQHPERIHHNIALVAERMNKAKLAEKHYQLALQENPTYYLSLMRLGQLYERSKRPNEAQQQFYRAREACLRCFDPIYALVSQQLGRGQGPSAVALIQDYLGNKEVEAADRNKARKLLSQAQSTGAGSVLSIGKRPAAKGTPLPLR